MLINIRTVFYMILLFVGEGNLSLLVVEILLMMIQQQILDR